MGGSEVRRKKERQKQKKKKEREKEKERGGEIYMHTFIKQLTKKQSERVTQTDKRHTDRHLEYFYPFFFHMKVHAYALVPSQTYRHRQAHRQKFTDRDAWACNVKCKVHVQQGCKYFEFSANATG